MNGLEIIATDDQQYALLCSDGNALLLHKINPNGEVLWSKTYHINSSKGSGAIVETSDKGFAIGTDSDSDAYLLKTNSAGDSLWSHTYALEGREYVTSLLITNDNHFILAGNRWGEELGSNSKIHFIETDMQGDTLRTRSYGHTNDLFLQDLKQGKDGSLYILGYNDEDVLLVKTNAVGDTLLTKTYGGGEYESGVALVLSTDGQTLSLLGSTESFGAGGTDFYFIKTDAMGNILTHYVDQNMLEAQIQVSPNPFTEQVSIRLAQSGHADVYDAKGRAVGSYAIDQQRTLSIEGPQGLYFVKISIGGQTLTYKVVKL